MYTISTNTSKQHIYNTSGIYIIYFDIFIVKMCTKDIHYKYRKHH